jgi:hypothetical protein
LKKNPEKILVAGSDCLSGENALEIPNMENRITHNNPRYEIKIDLKAFYI